MDSNKFDGNKLIEIEKVCNLVKNHIQTNNDSLECSLKMDYQTNKN